MQNAIGNESTFGIDTTELHKRQMAEKLQRLTDARCADDDGNGYDARNGKAPSDYIADLVRTCYRAVRGGGNRQEFAANGQEFAIFRSEHRVIVAAINIGGNPLRVITCEIGDSAEPAIARAIEFVGKYAPKAESEVDEDEERNNRLRKRVNDAFNWTGFYECSADNLVVTLPDGDKSFIEVGNLLDGSFERFQYMNFVTAGPVEEDIAVGLAADLANYLREVIGNNPRWPGQRGVLHKLFISWRIQPEIAELRKNWWSARARFVAAWADKKFEPKPGADGDQDFAEVDELPRVPNSHAIDALKYAVAAIPKITGIDPSWSNRPKDAADLSEAALERMIEEIKGMLVRRPDGIIDINPAFRSSEGFSEGLVPLFSDGKKRFGLALPPGEKAKQIVKLKVPGEDESFGPLLFVVAESGKYLFARKPGFGDTWYALAANNNVVALYHAWLDEQKGGAHHDRALAAIGHSFNPQTDFCTGCQMALQELVEVGAERAPTCATRLAEITIGGQIGSAIARELPPAGLEQAAIGGYKLRN